MLKMEKEEKKINEMLFAFGSFTYLFIRVYDKFKIGELSIQSENERNFIAMLKHQSKEILYCVCVCVRRRKSQSNKESITFSITINLTICGRLFNFDR